MRAVLSLLFVAAILSSPFAEYARCQQSSPDFDKALWLAGVLDSVDAITVGASREQLEKQFRIEGGFHGGPHLTFVYRECPYISVDVDFDHISKRASDDKITFVSRPYLKRHREQRISCDRAR